MNSTFSFRIIEAHGARYVEKELRLDLAYPALQPSGSFRL